MKKYGDKKGCYNREWSNRPIVDATMLTWAFRYCLGRRTYAVGDCVDNILANWDKIDEHQKDLFVKEIKEYEKQWGKLGDECDISSWYTIVKRVESEKFLEKHGRCEPIKRIKGENEND